MKLDDLIPAPTLPFWQPLVKSPWSVTFLGQPLFQVPETMLPLTTKYYQSVWRLAQDQQVGELMLDFLTLRPEEKSLAAYYLIMGTLPTNPSLEISYDLCFQLLDLADHLGFREESLVVYRQLWLLFQTNQEDKTEAQFSTYLYLAAKLSLIRQHSPVVYQRPAQTSLQAFYNTLVDLLFDLPDKAINLARALDLFWSPEQQLELRQKLVSLGWSVILTANRDISLAGQVIAPQPDINQLSFTELYCLLNGLLVTELKDSRILPGRDLPVDLLEGDWPAGLTTILVTKPTVRPQVIKLIKKTGRNSQEASLSSTLGDLIQSPSAKEALLNRVYGLRLYLDATVTNPALTNFLKLLRQQTLISEETSSHN